MRNNNPDGGLLIICLLMTLVIAIGAGLLISVDSMNPIETLMFFVRDGFTSSPTPPDGGGDVLDNGDMSEPEFIMPDISFPPASTDEDIIIPDTTLSPETTQPRPETNGGQPETTDKPKDPETTVKPPATTVKPPETTAKPPETTVKPPETTVKPPETTKPPATTTKPAVSDEEYFSDVLFLGDSRTVGFALYARIPNATYFARTSMNASNVFADKPSETSDTKSYANLAALLSEKKFGKIYILLGINEIGYSYSWIVDNYSKTLEYIRMYQPDAKIIIQSNMHVTKKKSDANPNTFSNARINELNSRLSRLADGKNIFYLGFEEIFDDSTGAMNPTYSGDGVHLYGKCYKLWRDWILENGKIY